ncbi:conserved membrane protein of unknown function [Candidatus Hydrogenisulfobacillus filiaventi]|uniref:Quinol oxidase subunit 4 n=1 Tax=Candidatus Hydrogenisulfobacillus filiaventi TaxID=2707344 RepID=A0A6F8ZF28_9FIRM|nr:cytochrome C oxidase subunit IV family protein [Bacillota bacterium]CAB1128270.1 conserved membrane protein of unknown function [Candidatus Hydrogenisulfobacillus filiaventi]
MNEPTAKVLSHEDGAHEDDLPLEVGSLAPRFDEHPFPWKQVAGYGTSLALTAVAFAMVLLHVLPGTALVAAILALALVQALVQLAAFMHLYESRSTAWHVPMISLAFLFAFGLVAGSIWIMMFKSGVS